MGSARVLNGCWDPLPPFQSTSPANWDEKQPICPQISAVDQWRAALHTKHTLTYIDAYTHASAYTHFLSSSFIVFVTTVHMESRRGLSGFTITIDHSLESIRLHAPLCLLTFSLSSSFSTSALLLWVTLPFFFSHFLSPLSVWPTVSCEESEPKASNMQDCNTVYFTVFQHTSEKILYH